MPAAGSGARLGTAVPKTLIEIAGKPLFVHAADLLVRHPDCVEAVIAAPAGFEVRYADAAEREWHDARVHVVVGGRVRQESVGNALCSLRVPCDAVLIHDAARPFVTTNLIDRVLDALSGDCVAVVPGIPVTDTIKRIVPESQVVHTTIDRDELVAVQTPQAIDFAVATEAYRRVARDGFEGTDDVSLIEHCRLGAIRVVDGEPGNFKITTPEDLARARERLERAYDRHRTAR